jgi:hypothetical protein
MHVAMENLDAAIAVTGQPVAVAGPDQSLEQRKVTAEAEHAGRPAAEDQVAQRDLARAKVLDDEPLPRLEIVKHRGREARPTLGPHESPQRGIAGTVEDIELGQLEQLPINGRVKAVLFDEVLVTAPELENALIAMRQVFFSTVQMTGKPVHSHLVRNPMRPRSFSLNAS